MTADFMHEPAIPREGQRKTAAGEPLAGLPGFKRGGFYLHACWRYKYPFAVRTWTLPDYDAMFRLLRGFGLDQVMIWPMSEVTPPPLSEDDTQYLMDFRQIVQKARNRGLECWLTFCPNLSSTDQIRSAPPRDRVFYPYMRKFRLDDATDFNLYARHLLRIMECLNNADGYVFIDGDPGGYPGARPEEFLRLLTAVRGMLDQVAAGQKPKIIPWVWCGWGTDWETEGVWKPDLRKLVQPFLHAIKAAPPVEPWELLPGRSIREGHANGRINLELTEEAGLLDRATLMTYEIIEFEPVPPAFIIQFEDIRRVIRQEMRLAPLTRGIMGNAQQPVTALHNLFYFARCTKDPAWLDKSDDHVLRALADFFGGNPDLLVPAWQITRADLKAIPPDLTERLRHSRLSSEWAECIPGGPALYLDILAGYVETCISVHHCVASFPRTGREAASALRMAVHGLLQWWLRHKYMFSGETAAHFDWAYLPNELVCPLSEWAQRTTSMFDSVFLRELAEEIAEQGGMEVDMASAVIAHLIKR